jgi:hypothetical protein
MYYNNLCESVMCNIQQDIGIADLYLTISNNFTVRELEFSTLQPAGCICSLFNDAASNAD